VIVRDSQSAAAAVISWDADLGRDSCGEILRSGRLRVSRVLDRNGRGSAAFSKPPTKATVRFSLLPGSFGTVRKS
jgi:hypothetical protein